jgi:hypothetical protein
LALRDPGITIPSLGFHSRGMYVSLIGRLARNAASGTLTVQHGGEHRRLYFVAGLPVWYESSRTADMLTDAELEDPDIRARLVKRGIAGPLRWDRGGWTFEPSDGLPAELLLRSVFLDCSPLAPLWLGVRESVGQDEVLGPMTDRTAGPVLPQPGLAANLALLELDGPLAGLSDSLQRPASVPGLLREYAHQHQDFFKLLWMIEALGWVQREGNRDVALGLVPPLDEPGDPNEQISAEDLAEFFARPLSAQLAIEPETKEIRLDDLRASVPPGQVIDAIRQGRVPESPSSMLASSADFEPIPEGESGDFPEGELLGEWGGSPRIEPLTRTVPSAMPSDVLPDLPSYRPSSRTAEGTGRYARSAPGSAPPRRVSSPSRPVSLPSRPISSAPPRGPAPSPRPEPLESIASLDDIEPPSLRAPGYRTSPGTNPTAKRIPTLRGSRLSSAGSAPAAPSAGAVQRDHASRMGTDYYTFLGIPAKANQSVIDRARTRLLKRWTAASKDPRLPEEARQMARELAQVTHLAGRTFSVPARRQEYDRRLAKGQAPLAGGVRAARTRDLPKTNPGTSLPTAPLEDALADARGLMRGQDFARAATLLKALRVQQPSQPDVLAELGWAVWKASAETERDEAEEYLQLATAFDPRHGKAREYLARVALDAGDHDAARQRLERLLKVDPEASWARGALNRIPVADDGRSGGRRLAFWKK